MKKISLPLLVILMLISQPASAEILLSSATFSSDLKVGSDYKWNINNYQIGDRRIETKTSPDAFEFIHGSRIDLTILKDPSEIDLSRRSSLSNATGFDSYFELKYDNLLYDFAKADLLYIWIFPVIGLDIEGNSVNLISEFWIHNLQNLFLNGDTLEFNSSLPSAEVSISEDDGEYTVNYVSDTVTLQARVDSSRGVMNAINYVSTSPDFRIEIGRRGGGSALPTSPSIFIFTLVLIPVVRKIRRSSLEQ